MRQRHGEHAPDVLILEPLQSEVAHEAPIDFPLWEGSGSSAAESSHAPDDKMYAAVAPSKDRGSALQPAPANRQHHHGHGAPESTALEDDVVRLRSQMRTAIARIRTLEAEKATAAWQLASASWAAGASGDEQPPGGTSRWTSGREDDMVGRQDDDVHACAVEAKIMRLARQLQLRTRQLQVGPARLAPLSGVRTPVHSSTYKSENWKAMVR